MSELLAHLAGDYLIQSDWMANQKTKTHLPAAAHAVSYAACFLPLTRNPKALAVIGGTHFVIDRWRLARHVVWAKNQLAPEVYRHPWDEHVQGTGYHRESTSQGLGWDMTCSAQAKPAWMAVWLMIVADNSMHGLLNHWALRRWARGS
jgi:hypothetical protein